MKVFIETYGCQMNVNDSEVALSILQKAGYERCETMDAADLIRLYLTAANMHANGYSVQSILDALNKTIDKEENPKFPVSREYIDKFISNGDLKPGRHG